VPRSELSQDCGTTPGGKMWTLLSSIWTVILVLLIAIFFVYLPYNAIVEKSWLFWSVVAFGLAISFICSASELAFGLACGESAESETYTRNRSISHQQRSIADSDNASDEEKAEANAVLSRVERLMKIGEAYATSYNPTLVVINTVANIAVAVISAAAAFDVPVVQRVGSQCPWLAASSWLANHAPQLRCTASIIPFPVNGEFFQSALAFTLILVIGEIVPKQLATAFPEQMTHLLYPFYRLIAVLSLGTGPAFGALGRLVQAVARSIPTVISLMVALRRQAATSARSIWHFVRTVYEAIRQRLPW
jgi:hypothetical protein